MKTRIKLWKKTCKYKEDKNHSRTMEKASLKVLIMEYSKTSKGASVAPGITWKPKRLECYLGPHQGEICKSEVELSMLEGLESVHLTVALGVCT